MKNQALLICLFILSVSLSFSQIVRFPLTKIRQDKNSNSEISFNFLEQGRVDITNYYNDHYFAVVRLGSQSKRLNVKFDTGTSILWVRDAKTFDSKLYNGFSCEKSSTCSADKSQSQTKNISYIAKSSMTGYKITDQLRLGNFTIPDYNLLLAQQTTQDIPKVADGFMGLGLSETNPNFPSILERLKDSGLISTKTFSMFLGDEPEVYDGSVTGEFIFGGYDPQYAKEDFRFINVHDISGFWGTSLEQLNLGTEGLISEKPLSVVLDSGNAYLYLPGNIFRNVLTQLNKINPKQETCYYNGLQSSYDCKCSEVPNLPNLTLHFDGNSFSIPSSAYTRNALGRCFLLIAEMEARRGIEGILGGVFLNNYYALYSVENKTVGLAAVSKKSRYLFVNKTEQEMVYYAVGFVVFIVVWIIVAIVSCIRKRNAIELENQLRLMERNQEQF